MIADALIRSRAGTVDDSNLGKLRPVYYPAVGLDAQIGHWEPIVRFHLTLSELTQRLDFRGTGVVVDKVGLHVRGAGAKPLIWISRPKNAKVFEQQMDMMRAWAELREDRATEIQAQMMPQVAFWSAVCGLQPNRHRRTFEFLNLALALAATTVFRFKNVFSCPRPVEYWPGLQPMIPTPEHGAYPSGHATEAFMAVHILAALASYRRDRAEPESANLLYAQLAEQASRIALNRTIAGLHFPIDSFAGEELGTALAEYLLAAAGFDRVKGKGVERVQWRAGRHFKAEEAESKDYVQHTPKTTYSQYLTSLPAASLAFHIPAVTWLFDEAKREWM